MKTYEVYSIENNLASLQTTVRFRVWQKLVTMDQMVDECKVTLEGRYDLNDEGLLDAIENVYDQEITNG
jgi:hypothetical protein